MLCLILHVFSACLKYQNHNMIFLLNPCHIFFTGLTVMLLWPTNTPFLQHVHSYWLSWLFAPVLMLVFPYDWGSTPFMEKILCYGWHVLAVFGPFVLMRRYGANGVNLICGFCSFIVYEGIVLVPVSRLTMVNLNYVLCSFGDDVVYNWIGHHYLIYYSLMLFLASCVVRMAFHALTQRMK